MAPAWLAGTTGLMATLYTARNLTMDVSDDKVEISGEVETEAEKAQLIAEATASYGDKFSESIKVVKTPPTAEELAAIEAAKLAEAEKARLIAEAEAARLAEENRLAQEAEAARKAEEIRLAAEAEAARLAEEARLAAEAKVAELKEKVRLAEIAKEEQRLADIQAAKLKAAEEEAALLASCQSEFEQMLSDNPSFFNPNSSIIKGASYPVFGMLAQKVNYCSDILHTKKLYIDVTAHAGEGDTSPLNSLDSELRTHSAISYLEMISGAHPGLLRPSSIKTAGKTSGNSQLHFNITE